MIVIGIEVPAVPEMGTVEVSWAAGLTVRFEKLALARFKGVEERRT